MPPNPIASIRPLGDYIHELTFSDTTTTRVYGSFSSLDEVIAFYYSRRAQNLSDPTTHSRIMRDALSTIANYPLLKNETRASLTSRLTALQDLARAALGASPSGDPEPQPKPPME